MRKAVENEKGKKKMCPRWNGTESGKHLSAEN